MRRHGASPAPAGEAVAALGFRPGARPWGREALSLRPLDLRSQESRRYDFVFTAERSESRRWHWREAVAAPGLALERVELRRERDLVRALADDPAGAARFLLATVLGLGVLALAAALGARRRPGRPERSLSPWLAGAAAYPLAGLLFLAASRALPVVAGEGAAGSWSWLPSLDEFGAGWPVPIAAGFALLAAAWLGALARRAPASLWAVPAALLALHFAGAGYGPRGDFQVYHVAGLAQLEGVDPYGIRPERVLNPPPFVLACIVIPGLGLPLAAFLWFGLKSAAALALVPLARRLVEPCGAVGSFLFRAPAIAALLACGRFVYLDLAYGNTNLLVLLSLLALAVGWRRGRRRAAGAAAALGAAIKLTPAVAVVAGGLAGRWRWAVGTLGAIALLFALSGVALEALAPGAGTGFVREAAPDPGDLALGRADNQSLRGMTDRFVGGAEARSGRLVRGPTLALGAGASRAVEAVLALAVVLGLWRLARRADRAGAAANAPGAWLDLWAGAALALLLVSPGSWTVHFVVLYLPLVALAVRAGAGDRFAATVFFVIAAAVWLPALSRSAGEWAAALSALTGVSLLALAALLRPFAGGRGASGKLAY